MSKFQSHDDYIAASPEQFRPLLTDRRAQLASALPDAKEIIAYNMPDFQIGKAMVVGFAAFSKQCGIYVSHSAIIACAADIEAAGLKAAKMGVTFSEKKPLPGELATKLALAARADYGV